MKKIIKEIALQAFIITFMINLIIGIILLIDDGGSSFINKEFPISTVVCGVLTGLAYLVYYIPRLKFIFKIIIHFIVVLALVGLSAFLFKWVDSLLELLPIYISVVVIYISVWVIMYLMDMKDANEINKALQNIKDDE